MGQTIQTLAERPLPPKAIFNNRFVVESCETFHFHYRNLRINLNFQDWLSMGKGFADAFARWMKKGQPVGKHSELCRKDVARFPVDEGLKINLNKNLYVPNEGKIFSEGADLKDEFYIHFKVRDIRLEFTEEEFNVLADAVKEAKGALDEIRRGSSSLL
jgi:hypothetical protein